MTATPETRPGPRPGQERLDRSETAEEPPRSARQGLPGLRDVPWTPAADTLDRASRLISPKVGLIRRIRTIKRRAQDPTLVTAIAEATDLSRFSGFPKLQNGGGTAETLEGAMAAAIGECVERYCLFFGETVRSPAVSLAEINGPLTDQAMVVARHEEVEEHAVALPEIRLYSRQQVEAQPEGGPLRYLDSKTPLRWIWAYSLTRGEWRLVPASRVFFSLHPEEAYVGQANTTGLGAGGTYEEAIHSGLLEVIERDAVALAWLHRRAARRLEIDDPALQRHLEECFLTDRSEVDLQLYDLQTDLPVPVVLSILRRPTESGPYFAMAAAARLDPAAAVRKALREQAQTFPLFRQLIRARWQPADDFSNLVDFEHHLLLYLRRPEMIQEELAFFGEAPVAKLSEVASCSTGRVLGDLEVCVAALQSRGFEVLVVDLTTPDIAASGFRVVRVVVPGLVMLHGDNLPCLGPPRALAPPEDLVWKNPGWNLGAGPNLVPHPFA